jgi:ABC-type multidrug transport system ATPase subunit
MTSKIIAICGHEGSGKSTSARYIASALSRRGHSVKIISFASPLKELCSVHLGVDKTNRRALEEFSMDIRRILGNDVFTKYTMSEIDSGLYEYYVIDDLRYINEVEALHASGYLTYILKARNIESAREMDDLRLDEILKLFDNNKIAIIDIPESYDNLYSFVEQFVELVR